MQGESYTNSYYFLEFEAWSFKTFRIRQNAKEEADFFEMPRRVGSINSDNAEVLTKEMVSFATWSQNNNDGLRLPDSIKAGSELTKLGYKR